jgi:RimJ/RimL family protein N-acetyltransferase
MIQKPRLSTERLVLRPLELYDAQEVQSLAGDRRIASTTLTIPHPYEDGMAEAWIGSTWEQLDRREAVVLAITEQDRGAFLGVVSLHLRLDHERGELGYWIGKPYWGQGYVTEAAQALVRYGFEELGLNRIYASHFGSNPASGRVMEKLGMRYEGLARQHVKKWGVFEDLKTYSILRADYEALSARAARAAQA